MSRKVGEGGSLPHERSLHLPARAIPSAEGDAVMTEAWRRIVGRQLLGGSRTGACRD